MANVLTSLRILCGILMLFCPAFSKGFFFLYLLGGFTDAIDGTVARKLGKATPSGAKLDTVADAVFLASALVKALGAVKVPPWLLLWAAAIALFKAGNVIVGLVRHHRFVSVHSALNKVCGGLLFAVPLYVGSLPWQVTSLLLGLTCTAATFAAIGEGRLIRAGKDRP